MESILTSFPTSCDVVQAADPQELLSIYTVLSSLLRQLSKSTTTFTENINGESPALWLYKKCSSIKSPLGPLEFILATLDALKSSNKEQDLFDLFGEQDVELLFEIIGREAELTRVREDEIRALARETHVDETRHTADVNGGTSRVEEHLHKLRNDAYDLTNLLSTLRQDLSSSSADPAGSSTHIVMRKSDKDAEKVYKKAVKQAAIALERAREAGALTESDQKILIALKEGTEIDYSQLGDQYMNISRGLDGMDERQIQFMKANLMPEGTKVFDSSFKRGLPSGAIREIKEGYERVIIPAPILDKSKLPKRIVLDEVLCDDERVAFAGTTSLNPMQSTVFHAAYSSRENLLICAPTGAGVSSCIFSIDALAVCLEHTLQSPPSQLCGMICGLKSSISM